MVEQYQPLVTNLINELKLFLNSASPELVTSALESGIYLTGGGSLVPEIAVGLEETFRVPVTMSLTPQLDVIQGLQKL